MKVHCNSVTLLIVIIPMNIYIGGHIKISILMFDIYLTAYNRYGSLLL